MPSVEIAGMTGRGSANLYRQVFYRTAGGSYVCSREMEDGGIKHYNMHEYAEMFCNAFCNVP